MRQTYECNDASEITMKHMGKICHYKAKMQHNKAGACMIIGMYCVLDDDRPILKYLLVTTVFS